MDFKDILGRKIRLTEERRKHISERPEMKGQKRKIRETLKSPDIIKQSSYDENVLLFYRLYPKTPVTEKYLLVVVKIEDKKGFVVTSFFTDKIKKGVTVWEK